MNYKKTSIEDLKKLLDEKGIDYSEAQKKDDFIKLLEDAAEEVEPDIEEEQKPQGLVGTIKSALKVEKTVTKTVDKYAYLDGRDYQQLDVAERELVRQRSREYESKPSGVQVNVTDRLTGNHQLAKIADGKWVRFIKGSSYVLSQEDFEVLKGETVKVKTVATKDKCCGQAVYEEIPLLEVVND